MKGIISTNQVSTLRAPKKGLRSVMHAERVNMRETVRTHVSWHNP